MTIPVIEHSFSCMVEKVADYAIFLLDCDGVIQTWNPAAVVIKGYSADEAIGRPFDILYTEEDRQRGHPAHNLRIAAEQGTFQEETWRQRKDGSLFWALVEIIAIRCDAGQLSGYCKLTRDISKRRAMEQALREADRRKDEFLAMLAHELRNPLAPVSAAAELLSTGRLQGEATKQAGRVIIRQVRHMTELVDDLLDVTRIARGQIELDLITVDIRDAISGAIEQARPLIDSRRHTLSVTVAPVTAYVKGDQMRLIQVIANLLNNAAKYTPPGGMIGVALSATDSNVCVKVSDNGMGIEPEVQKGVFDLFEQARRSSERGTGGLGIGLSLVRSITSLHGGSVSCDSAGLGRGSRFSVCIPRLPADQAMPERRRFERPAEPEGAGAPLSILVVDDNVDAAQMVEFFLASGGHAVRLAHSAKTALQDVTAQMPDVCILDINLPDSTGYELAAAIRRLGSPAPLLIALSGYGMARRPDGQPESGFDHYFVKPVDLDELTAALERVAPRRPADRPPDR